MTVINEKKTDRKMFKHIKMFETLWLSSMKLELQQCGKAFKVNNKLLSIISVFRRTLYKCFDDA